MKSSDGDATIGELAAHFGLATHVLRHWESEGLLSPRRTAAGNRVYGHVDRYRIAAILQAKQAGMELNAIREILTATTPDDRNAVLRRQHDKLVERIKDVAAALDLVDAGLSCRHGDLASCPRFRSLLAGRVTSRPADLDPAGTQAP